MLSQRPQKKIKKKEEKTKKNKTKTMKTNNEICKWKKHIDNLIEQNPSLEEKIMEYKDRTMLMACYVCDGYNQECGSYETE